MSSAETTRVPGTVGEEALEPGDQRGKVAPVGQVIGFHVGDDRGLGRELEECPVALVGFDDEPLAVVPRRVRTDLVEVATDEEARVPVGFAEDQREHRRRRGLAVAPCDGDRAAHGHDRTLRVGAAEDGHAELVRTPDLGVRRRDRGRRDDGVDVLGDVAGIVTDTRVDAECAQALERSRVAQVGAADLGAPSARARLRTRS